MLKAEFHCNSYGKLGGDVTKRPPRPRYFNPCWVKPPAYEDAIQCGVRADK
eukprot:gene3500-2098_t